MFSFYTLKTLSKTRHQKVCVQVVCKPITLRFFEHQLIFLIFFNQIMNLTLAARLLFFCLVSYYKSIRVIPPIDFCESKRDKSLSSFGNMINCGAIINELRKKKLVGIVSIVQNMSS